MARMAFINKDTGTGKKRKIMQLPVGTVRLQWLISGIAEQFPRFSVRMKTN
jgi:hypothetical protein